MAVAPADCVVGCMMMGVRPRRRAGRLSTTCKDIARAIHQQQNRGNAFSRLPFIARRVATSRQVIYCRQYDQNTLVSLVLDTDVLIAAVRSPNGASAEILRRVRKGQMTMLATVPLFIEYEAVITRPEHMAAAGARLVDVLNVLDVLAALVERVEPHFLWRPQLRDPDDEMVLEAAVNGRADAIATFNARDFGRAGTLFGVSIAAPAEILKGS